MLGAFIPFTFEVVPDSGVLIAILTISHRGGPYFSLTGVLVRRGGWTQTYRGKTMWGRREKMTVHSLRRDTSEENTQLTA